VSYFASVKTFNPSADGNWKLQPVPGVKLRFASSSAAIAHLKANQQIRLIQDNGDGSALYEVVP
jgi:2',3'-cyclic-nucleotide 2'-phosphodiesterase / 3'-nucleotidase